MLGLGLVTLILSSLVNPNTNPVGLVTLMKGQRSKVTDLLYLYNCQLGLGLGLVTLNLSSLVNPNTNHVGLVTLIKGQRSKVSDLLFLYNCQLGLGLGLVTLILSSVVNSNTNPDPNPKRTCRKNGCDDSSGSV